MTQLKLLSLFDGIGGFPISYSNVLGIPYTMMNYDSSEIVPFLNDIIKKEFPKSRQLNDITKLNFNHITADIITMGTPCPGFSIAGKGDGLENDESKLFEIGINVINHVRPKYFVWENVFGVLSSKKGETFRKILDEFKKIGYDISWTLLDSKFFGLPHRRRRIYVIGVRDGIDKNNNIFDFNKRQCEQLISNSKNTDSFFASDLNIKSTTPKEHYAFFNRQRSDKFKEIGISNTSAKRDYKGSTDVIIKNGSIRRVVPKERLRLQGIPDYWFDSSYASNKSDIKRFQANGMSIPVVEYVLNQMLSIENKECYNNSTDFDCDEFISNSAINIFLDKSGKQKNIPPSGQMLLNRKHTKIINEEAKYRLAKKCSESSPTIVLKKIEDILEDEVESKFHITKGGCEGYLKREIKSGNNLPKKMKEVIFYKYPELKALYSNL